MRKELLTLPWFVILAAAVSLSPHPVSAFSMGYHYDLIREAMRKEGFGKDARCLVLAGNSYTDFFQKWETEGLVDLRFVQAAYCLVDVLHCDGLPDTALVRAYWSRLIQNTRDVVTSKSKEGDNFGLLLALGVVLHVAQDFYAHSNWAELDVSRFSGIRDATYLDVMGTDPGILKDAIMAFSNSDYQPYEADGLPVRGLFTHGKSTVDHDVLNKDHAGRAYFDWSYRCAYKATLEILDLVSSWLTPQAWKQLLDYQCPEEYHEDLYTLTRFKCGTIRRAFLYAAAWKSPCQCYYDDLTIALDDMPNVKGIGYSSGVGALDLILDNGWTCSFDHLETSLRVTSPPGAPPGVGDETGVSLEKLLTYLGNGNPPFLGIKWYRSCVSITNGLFEAHGKSTDSVTQIVFDANKGWLSNKEVPRSVVLNASESVWNSAAAHAAQSLAAQYKTLQWLRVCVPNSKIRGIPYGPP